MCKAKLYLKQLEEITIQANKDYIQHVAKENRFNELQQDMLHVIENKDCSAEEKIRIFDSLQNMRKERRKVKQDKRMLEEVNKYYRIFNSEVEKFEVKEKEYTENWKYTYRSNEFREINGKSFISKQIEKQQFIGCSTNIKQNVIDIKLIKIPLRFLQTPPKQDKYNRIKQSCKELGRLDKSIEINSNMLLTDGYIRYLIAKEIGLKEVPIIITFNNHCGNVTSNIIGNNNHVTINS